MYVCLVCNATMFAVTFEHEGVEYVLYFCPECLGNLPIIRIENN